jgi:hypothetical protein
VTRPFVAFHFGLVQDVAVLRPLVRLAASSCSTNLHLLVSNKFAELDSDGRWVAELERLGSEVGVAPFVYESAFDCLERCGPGRGMIVAGSESDARAHLQAHELFRAVPGRYRTVTLQHGLECVGFLHNARHDAAAGRAVRFAADIAVAWFDLSHAVSVSATERSKIFVAGPPNMIDPVARVSPGQNELPPLICENLHSVRFVNGRMREAFLETFVEFASRLRMVGERLVLRPHPAGRFTDRKGISLPDNVAISREPLYDMDLGAFSYVISAPSTILFDFALAGVPAATWVDTEGQVDARNFAGLPRVATVDDWWRFHWAARWKRQRLLDAQEEFVRRQRIPGNVRERYAALLSLASAQ